MFTASQIIAALVERLGGGPIVLTLADAAKWQTKYPTLLQASDDGTEITVSISPKAFATNQKLK